MSEKFPNRYSPSVDKGISFDPKEGRTKQSFKAECDINNILKRYEKSGLLPDLIKTNPQYGDFSNVPDYQESLNIVHKAHEQFALLDSRVRKRFDNDPAKFLAFASDPHSGDEMVALGLATIVPSPETPTKGSGKGDNTASKGKPKGSPASDSDDA